MKRNFVILFCLFFLLVLPNVVSADCMEVGNADKFIIDEDDAITLYRGQELLVKIEVNCNVLPTSKIHFLKSYACEGDDILIDDSTCNIVSLKR